jgi:hypothetical protein
MAAKVDSTEAWMKKLVSLKRLSPSESSRLEDLRKKAPDFSAVSANLARLRSLALKKAQANQQELQLGQ